MPNRPVELPDNVPDCHAVILRQADRIDELEARVDQLLARVDELVAEVASLRRELHGSRRERFIPERTENDPPPEPPPPEPQKPRTSAGRRPRTIDPSIPREKIYQPLREGEYDFDLPVYRLADGADFRGKPTVRDMDESPLGMPVSMSVEVIFSQRLSG